VSPHLQALFDEFTNPANPDEDVKENPVESVSPFKGPPKKRARTLESFAYPKSTG
jgi:hypothetical protein